MDTILKSSLLDKWLKQFATSNENMVDIIGLKVIDIQSE